MVRHLNDHMHESRSWQICSKYDFWQSRMLLKLSQEKLKQIISIRPPEKLSIVHKVILLLFSGHGQKRWDVLFLRRLLFLFNSFLLKVYLALLSERNKIELVILRCLELILLWCLDDLRLDVLYLLQRLFLMRKIIFFCHRFGTTVVVNLV